MKETIRKRAIRSDKKRDVKPTVSTELKNCIYRLSYITSVPVKDIVETFCEKGLQSRSVMEFLSSYFIRDYKFSNTIYMGNPSKESLQNKFQSSSNVRISTRFTQESFDRIRDLSDALDCTPSKTTSLLLDASIKNTNLINAFVKLHLHDHLNNARMKELKSVLKYVNQNNPYQEEISWFTLVSLIFEDIKDGSRNIKNMVHSWLDRNTN